jgi:1,4-alpha-glucan branching enzyme
MVYRRMGKKEKDDIIVILNMLPQPRMDFEITVKGKKRWEEVFNSNSLKYWGAGDVYNTVINSELLNKDEKQFKLTINLPPLCGIILK